MSEVRQLPLAPRTCHECLNLELRIQRGLAYSWCSQWNEEIVSEKAAASDCLAYEPDPDVGRLR